MSPPRNLASVALGACAGLLASCMIQLGEPPRPVGREAARAVAKLTATAPVEPAAQREFFARRRLVLRRAQILDALWQVESSGAIKAPRGDGGRSRGPLQISWAYWLDSRIPGGWSDCEDIHYSRQVVAAYMRRYVPRAWAAADAEVIARTHCAGPDGARQDCSLPYWRKVRTVLEGVK